MDLKIYALVNSEDFNFSDIKLESVNDNIIVTGTLTP